MVWVRSEGDRASRPRPPGPHALPGPSRHPHSPSGAHVRAVAARTRQRLPARVALEHAGVDLRRHDDALPPQLLRGDSVARCCARCTATPRATTTRQLLQCDKLVVAASHVCAPRAASAVDGVVLFRKGEERRRLLLLPVRNWKFRNFRTGRHVGE